MKKIIHYLPRILSALLVVFFGLFILEGFDPSFHWQDSVMHLIITLIVLIPTIIAWKNPRVGGWLFVLLGILAMFFVRPPVYNGLIFGGVFFLTSALFIADGRKT